MCLNGSGELGGRRVLAAPLSVGTHKIGVAEPARRCSAVFFPTAPQVAARKPAKNRWAPRIGTLPLQGVEDFLDAISHAAQLAENVRIVRADAFGLRVAACMRVCAVAGVRPASRTRRRSRAYAPVAPSLRYAFVDRRRAARPAAIGINNSIHPTPHAPNPGTGAGVELCCTAVAALAVHGAQLPPAGGVMVATFVMVLGAVKLTFAVTV